MIQCIDDETVIALQFIPKMLEVVALILSKQKINSFWSIFITIIINYLNGIHNIIHIFHISEGTE